MSLFSSIPVDNISSQKILEGYVSLRNESSHLTGCAILFYLKASTANSAVEVVTDLYQNHMTLL